MQTRSRRPAEVEQDNPLVEGLERLPVRPTALVIFGATGDLAHRKLLPGALQPRPRGRAARAVRADRRGPRASRSDEDFREMARESIERFSRRPARPERARRAARRHALRARGVRRRRRLRASSATCCASSTSAPAQPLNRVFYLSTAPQFFPVIAGKLGAAGLNRARATRETRIVIEKPFGYDLASARAAQRRGARRVRRVAGLPDRPLPRQGDGPEPDGAAVRQRAVRAGVEPQLHRPRPDHRRRGHRDRRPRRLLRGRRRAARPGPEPHAAAARAADDGAADRVRRRPRARREAQGARGDRAAGGRGRRRRWRCARSTARDGRRQARCPATARRRASAPDSRTETYAALRLHVSNWRWAGVPFYLRTGKRLARKVTEIAVTLKPVPHLAFQSSGSVGVQPNQIILTVQPDEGVSVSLGAKIPGAQMRIRPVNMEFRYGTSFLSESPEAYERLILDAMRGDATLFTRDDEIEALWGIIDPILTAWHEDTTSPIPQYPAGLGGTGRGGRAARGRPQVAAAVSEDVWSEQDTNPDAIEAALRETAARAPRRQPGARAGARAQPDRGRRPRVEGRDRQPARARRSLPRLAHDPVRGRGRPRHARRGRGDELRRAPGGGIGVMREQVEIDMGPEHLTGLETIVDPIVISELPTVLWSPARPRRGGRGAARDDRRDPARLRRRGRRRRRASRAPQQELELGVRGRPGVAAHDAVARAAGGQLRPARRAGRRWRRSTGSRSATSASSTASALLLAGWLASRLDWDTRPLAVGERRRPARTRLHRQLALRRHQARAGRAGRARAGRRHRGAGDRVHAVARPRAGRAARPRDVAGPRRARAGWCSAPRAARAGSSARASARRCCATPPTGRRSSAARELLPRMSG